jgi:hypothetical protein
MTVPFVEAVANRVELWLREMQDKGARWARMTLDTVNEVHEKRSTSPEFVS